MLFPLKLVAQMYFLQRTKRFVSAAEFFTNSTVLIEFVIFVTQIIYWYDYFLFSGEPYEGNKYIQPQIDYNSNQMYMVNIIYVSHEGIYRIDALLALIGFLIWLRLFFCFRISQTFGPMFRILYSMVQDLIKFIIIWFVIIIMFSCVGILAFGELETFSDLNKSFQYFISSGLGEFDYAVFELVDEVHGRHEQLYQSGVWFNILFLLINLVLMLNFVIAIMSSTFGNFEKVSVGLYMSTLIDAFPTRHWDDEFGSIACIATPISFIHFIALPMYLVVDSCCPKYLIRINMFISHLIFLPIGIFIWISLVFINLLLIPVAYLVQLWRIFMQLVFTTGSRLEHFGSLFLFLFIGPLILIASFFIDAVSLLVNIYNIPKELDLEVNPNILSEQSLQTLKKTCLEVGEMADFQIVTQKL